MVGISGSIADFTVCVSLFVGGEVAPVARPCGVFAVGPVVFCWCEGLCIDFGSLWFGRKEAFICPL